MSTAEEILEALKELLEEALAAEDDIPAALVYRNTASPEVINARGTVIIRDGDPGEADIPMGGFDAAYYAHNVEIEMYVQNASASVRDTAFDDLLSDIIGALESDRTLEGKIFGMTFSRPGPITEPVEGGDDIKAATLIVTMDYQAQTTI